MADELVDTVFADAEAQPPAEAAPPAEPQAPAPEPAPEPPAEPAPTPEPESPPQPEKVEHQVPLAKYLDTRDELKELKRWKAEQEAKAAAPKAPDPIDDPDGFARYQNSYVDQRLTAQKFEISDTIARQTHGAEEVEKAQDWALERAKADPVFASQYMKEAHPIDWIVRQHKRDALVSQLPTDVSSLDEFVEREIAKRGLSAPPAAPAQVVAVPVPAANPPRSIASEPAASGGVVDDTGDFLTGLLQR